MQFGNPLHDREPEPGRALLAAVAAPEAAEDQLAFVLADARALVEHADRGVSLDHEFDGRSRRGVVDGVFGEIADRAPQHFRIAVYPDRLPRAPQRRGPALRP